jgi:hypothetical protein
MGLHHAIADFLSRPTRACLERRNYLHCGLVRRYRSHAGLVIALFLVLLSWGVASAQAEMPGGSQYGIRIPAKIAGCYAPVASNLIGSDEKDHSGRGSPTLAYDWSASVGSPVFSICPGTVKYTAAAENREMGGYGWHVVIDHGNGVSTLYAHCDRQSFMVEKGQAVTAWTPICRVGMTGMTSWPHIHLNVQVNGAYTKVGQYFDPALIRYCHFTQCKATNKPDDPIAADGNVVRSGQGAGSGATVGEARIYTLLRSLQGLTPEQLLGTYFVFFLTVGFLLWLGSNLVRMIVIGVLTSTVTALVIVWLFVPPMAMATAATPQLAGDDSWNAFQTALRVTLKREGAGCDNYIVRTLHGVTQWTYDRYRREKGLPRADVCAALTQSEEEYIYYTYYWVPSGANQLPINAAVPVFDHYVNAGRKIDGCGSDVRCINQQRLQFYLGTNDCAQRTRVCQAWLDRVEYIRKLTEGS